MWHVLTSAVEGWSRHRVASLGAALAYYSVFSLGPLLLIVTATAGLIFGEDAVRGEITNQFRGLLGAGRQPGGGGHAERRRQSKSGHLRSYLRSSASSYRRARGRGAAERCAQHHLGSR